MLTYRKFVNYVSDIDEDGWLFFEFSSNFLGIIKIATGCPLLETLLLGRAEVTEKAAEALSQCKNLSYLKIPCGNITALAINKIIKVEKYVGSEINVFFS